MLKKFFDHFRLSNCVNLSHSKYRADIDGLRAVAILLVVFFHAFGLSGGFIGVDVFFVISGFLISTIIFNHLDSGNFSFLDFYTRRIRRIFPALSVVLIFCYIFSWMSLFSDEFKQVGHHIFSGTAFISNFTLMNENGYFDNSTDTKPLLHLWSLAVEEQFYIIWPLLVWFFWRWQKKINLFSVIFVIAIGSFVLNVREIHIDKIAAFYMPHTRFWELLCGSMLAYILIYHKNIILKFEACFDEKRLRDLVSIGGAILLILGVLLIKETANFPGFWALFPVSGAVLIIAAGPVALFNRVVLQNNILVWFGLISFPLYLWHWSLLSFTRIVLGEELSSMIAIIVVLISILLSWLTFKFVERPVRFGGFQNLKTVILVIMIVMIGYLGLNAYKQDGFKNRKAIANYQQHYKDLIEPHATRKSDGSCDSLGFDVKSTVCLLNDPKPEILIVGDSHAAALNSAAYLGGVDLKTLLIFAHDCLPFEKYSKSSKYAKHCQNIAIVALEVVKNTPSIKKVFINSYAPLGKRGFRKLGLNDLTRVDSKKTQQEMFVDGYSELISGLIEAGKEVVFVIDVPRLEHDPKYCVARPFKNSPENCFLDRKIIMQRQEVYREKIKEIEKMNPKLKVFDSLKVFCDANKCHMRESNKIYYWDKHHLSISGSTKLLVGIVDDNVDSSI